MVPRQEQFWKLSLIGWLAIGLLLVGTMIQTRTGLAGTMRYVVFQARFWRSSELQIICGTRPGGIRQLTANWVPALHVHTYGR